METIQARGHDGHEAQPIVSRFKLMLERVASEKPGERVGKGWWRS